MNATLKKLTDVVTSYGDPSKTKATTTVSKPDIQVLFDSKAPPKEFEPIGGGACKVPIAALAAAIKAAEERIKKATQKKKPETK